VGVVWGRGCCARCAGRRILPGSSSGLSTSAEDSSSDQLSGLPEISRFSPDGKQVAFAWNGEKEDNFDIYVKLVDAGTPLRLTSNPAPEWGPAWSPDARYIAFCRGFSDHAEIWVIPALGGAERKLGESSECLLDWSPDRKYLALPDKNAPREPYSIFLVSVERKAKNHLTA
jgi:Tol biopolymer transport system component